MKRCARCGDSKLVSEFYSAPNCKDGLTKLCKLCRRVYLRELRRQHPENSLLHSVRANARKRGRQCTLSVADIVIPLTCPVLGIPLRTASGRMDDNSPSVDRLDSSQGYTPENIRIISWRANRIKNDASVNELRAIVRWLEVQ